MFNPPKVAEWQWLDESCGLWYPWYTIGALEEISTWDLKDKNVFEYGGGRSTLWWANKAKSVFSIERTDEYWTIVNEFIRSNNLQNCQCHKVTACEGIQADMDKYVNYIDYRFPIARFDIVIVDDIFRYECMVKALTLPRPLTLIVDNWCQDFVFRCPAAEDLMKTYPGEFYIQEDHTNHEGNPWTTAIWHLK